MIALKLEARTKEKNDKDLHVEIQSLKKALIKTREQILPYQQAQIKLKQWVVKRFGEDALRQWEKETESHLT